MKKYYQNKPKFNGVYSRNNLSRIKDGAYMINFQEYESIRTNTENITYFDRFGVEHIPKKIRKFIGNKKVITNLYRTIL